MVGGGAATNSGMDFQARVGALVLVSMIAEVVDLHALGIGIAGETARQVRFETSDAVDDLVVDLDRGSIFVQAKNSLTLSESSGSELAKFVHQVVSAHSTHRDGDRYVLIVSTAASSRIRQELKKLCHAYRLNAAGAGINPLTKSESATLAIVREHVRREYEAAHGTPPGDSTIDEILRLIHVEAVDVADGTIGERMALTALSTVATAEPRLLWSALVSMCLSMARDRLSLDRAGLAQRLRGLVPLATDETDDVSSTRTEGAGGETVAGTAAATGGVGSGLTVEGGVSMGREVLLTAGDQDGRFYFSEFRRFDETGARRLRFTGDHVEVGPGVRWRVLRRTATHSGMSRELADGLTEQVRDKQVVVIETDLGDLDASPFAQAQAKNFQTLMESTSAVRVCLVCGRAVPLPGARSVEIDDEDHPYQAGFVHGRCLRPVHRIVGVLKGEGSQFSPSLVDFDISMWLDHLNGGQAAWHSPYLPQTRGIAHVAWNPDNSGGTTGGWAVEYDLSDGTTQYVTVRGRVHRASRQQARHMARQLNASIQRASTRQDPWVHGKRGYTQRSVAVFAQDPNPPEVVAHRAVPVTEATVGAYKTAENYYAPLFYLSDHDTGEFFTLHQVPVLLTDPLGFDDMAANWRHAGMELPESWAATIVSTDEQFDLFMARASAEVPVVWVDPVLDPAGELIGGFVVANLKDISRQPAGSDQP